MQKQGGGSYDVKCGCDMQKSLPDYAYSLAAARDVHGGTRRRRGSRTRKQGGGSCGSCGMPSNIPMMRGGGCGCSAWKANGGKYKATARNRKYLAKYRRGESIGFTMKASLKAKGLLPRTSKKNYGKKVLGPKYR